MDELSKSLLKEILKLSINDSKVLNAKRFRADRHEHLDLLDSLEYDGYIGKRDDNYFPRLLTILELLDSNAEAKRLFKKCEHIFHVLQKFYKDHPGENINLNNLSEISDLPRKDINICIAYMIEAPIFGGWSIKLNDVKDATVTPGERILRYKNFRDVIEIMRPRRSESSSEITVNEYSIDQKVDHIEDFQFLLHPKIAQHALQQYNNGHLRDAVLNSIIAVFDLIREKTGLKGDGDRLIGKAFSLEKPYLILSEIDTESGKNDQKGFMQIYKGSFQGIRNPKAHSLAHDITKLKAAQYLVFASLLARRIDEAKVIMREQK
ncbi:MAG: TIGR02391 family protein [Sedimentisphaerales bacterium]